MSATQIRVPRIHAFPKQMFGSIEIRCSNSSRVMVILRVLRSQLRRHPIRERGDGLAHPGGDVGAVERRDADRDLLVMGDVRLSGRVKNPSSVEDDLSVGPRGWLLEGDVD